MRPATALPGLRRGLGSPVGPAVALIAGAVLLSGCGGGDDDPTRDGNVTLEAGQTDEYTMLNWMSIEPVD